MALPCRVDHPVHVFVCCCPYCIRVYLSQSQKEIKCTIPLMMRCEMSSLAFFVYEFELKGSLVMCFVNLCIQLYHHPS